MPTHCQHDHFGWTRRVVPPLARIGVGMTPLRCHNGAMDVEPYVETIRHQLEIAAEVGGEDARALAERLVAPLESAIRLAVQDALSAAAEEINLELAPRSVELGV